MHFVASYHCMYGSLSQSGDEVENFVDNLDLLFETLTQKIPFLAAIIGDFNAKFYKWFSTIKQYLKGLRMIIWPLSMD